LPATSRHAFREFEEGQVEGEAAAAWRRMEAAAPGLAVPGPAGVLAGRTWAELRPLEGTLAS